MVGAAVVLASVVVGASVTGPEIHHYEGLQPEQQSLRRSVSTTVLDSDQQPSQRLVSNGRGMSRKR